MNIINVDCDHKSTFCHVETDAGLLMLLSKARCEADSSRPKQKHKSFTCSVIYPLILLWCELLSFGDISCRYVRQWNETTLGLWSSQRQKTEQSWLGKIIHTPCCEHVGAIFYVLNYTHHTCHSAEGKSASTHGDINERWRWRTQLEVMQLLGKVW